MKVRNASVKDIPAVVNIHLERFESFFLSTLGSDFLKVFYKAFLQHPGVLLVLEDEGQIKGFASGSPSNKGFYKLLLASNLISFTFVGLRILLTKPKALYRIFSNMKSSGEAKHTFAELLSIATVKNSKGFGSALIKAFESEIKKINESSAVDSLSLTTDYDNNKKVVDFYKSNGYVELSVFISYENRKMYRFIKKL